MTFNARHAGSLFTLCLLLAGCSDSPKLGIVSGTVKVDGKLVTEGTIMFVPAEGKAAVGSIGPDGTYVLTTNQTGDGAAVGSHRVTILATVVGPATMMPATFDDELAMANGKPGQRAHRPGKVMWIVPERFSQVLTTDLTAEVASRSQTIDFDLPSK